MKKFLYLITFVSGMSVMAVELSASRLLAPYFGTSLFVWTNIIGIILVALSVGYGVGGWLAEKSPTVKTLLRVILASSVSLFVIPLISPFLSLVSFESVFVNGSASTPIFAGSFVASLVLFFIPIMLLGMVSPMIIKLMSLETQKMGEASGRVFAVGTAGSFVGTFIPALLTIPTIGTRNTILLFAGCLFALAIIGLFAKRGALFLLMPAFAFHQIDAADAMLGPHELAKLETPYQYLRVVESDGTRYLVFNEGGGIQSVYRPGAHSYPGTYYDAAAHLPALVADPQHALILGLAGGTLATNYAALYPDLEITGVEIDPRVIETAKRHFGLDAARIRVIENDARMQLSRSAKQYDLIYTDAYSHQFYIPFHLATKEFFALAKSRLAPGGVFAMNINASEYDAPILASFAKTVGAVFPEVRIARVPGGKSWNWLLVAGDEVLAERLMKVATGPDDLRAVAAEVGETLLPYAGSGGMVLTDDRAPIEQMTDAMFWRYYNAVMR